MPWHLIQSILAKFKRRSHETVISQVRQLLSADLEERLKAIDYFRQPDVIIDHGEIHRQRFFTVLIQLSHSALQEGQVLYPETVAIMYQMMMTDPYPRDFEGQDIREIIKKAFSPLRGKIAKMISRHPKPFVIDAVLVNYWLARPVSDWDWNMIGVDNLSVEKCRELRAIQYRDAPS